MSKKVNDEMKTHGRTQFVVIGAGYAGMMAAIRLAGKTRRLPVDITLVNASDHFVERLRSHQIATHQTLRSYPLNVILDGTGVRFVQGRVNNIDSESRKVTLDDSGELSYDYLVYALGSMVDVDAVPGVREYAYTLNPSGENSAAQLGKKLVEMDSGHIVIVGGGATGIETATEIRDLFPHLKVTLLTKGEAGAFKSRRVQRYMNQVMREMGVEIVEHSPVQEVHEHDLVTADGKRLMFDVCIWAGGFKALPLAKQAGLAVNEQQQILTDPYMRSVSHPTIYAAGDSAYPVQQPGAPVRMSVFTALVMGAHTGDNLARLLKGKGQKPLGFAYYGQAVALGRHKAVGFATFPDDKPIGPLYTGKLGFNVRGFFVWFVRYALVLEKRIPGSFFWLGKNRGRAALQSPFPLSETPISPK